MARMNFQLDELVDNLERVEHIDPEQTASAEVAGDDAVEFSDMDLLGDPYAF